MSDTDRVEATGKGALIITPTYNERENLEALVEEVLSLLPDVHMLIIDDGSPDGTGEIADGLAAENDRLSVEHRSGKLGLGTAYIHGFKWALARGYEYVFEMDADFSHQPRFLPDFLREIQSSDLVLGCRYMPGGGTENWTWSRKVISQGGNLYARSILSLPFTDLTGGFKCFRRRVLETIDLDGIVSVGYNFQIELTYRAYKAGFRIRQTPIIFPDRTAGESKMSGAIFREALFGVWKLRFSKL